MLIQDLKIRLNEIGANEQLYTIGGYHSFESGMSLVNESSLWNIYRSDRCNHDLYKSFTSENEACHEFLRVIENSKIYISHHMGQFDNQYAANQLLERFSNKGIDVEVNETRIGPMRKQCFEVIVFGIPYEKAKEIRGY